MDAELRLGHGSEPDTTQGPLINTRAAEKVNSVIIVELWLHEDDSKCVFGLSC